MVMVSGVFNIEISTLVNRQISDFHSIFPGRFMGEFWVGRERETETVLRHLIRN